MRTIKATNSAQFSTCSNIHHQMNDSEAIPLNFHNVCGRAVDGACICTKPGTLLKFTAFSMCTVAMKIDIDCDFSPFSLTLSLTRSHSLSRRTLVFFFCIIVLGWICNFSLNSCLICFHCDLLMRKSIKMKQLQPPPFYYSCKFMGNPFVMKSHNTRNWRPINLLHQSLIFRAFATTPLLHLSLPFPPYPLSPFIHSPFVPAAMREQKKCGEMCGTHFPWQRQM